MMNLEAQSTESHFVSVLRLENLIIAQSQGTCREAWRSFIKVYLRDCARDWCRTLVYTLFQV